MAIHPTGHFFAAGYGDGSIAIWATEDEDKPLLVRSIEEVDINLINEEILNLTLEPNGSKPDNKPAPEPIQKLAWSGYSNSTDPRGGIHTLSVLGGGRGKEPSGVVVFSFSPFNPADSGVDPKIALPPVIRKAMRDCLSNPSTYTYRSETTISDFMLLPRDTPHFAGNFDPVAILLVFDEGSGKRSISIMEFPPKTLAIIPERQEMARTASSATTDTIGGELAEALHEMRGSSDPERLTSPDLFWTGSSSVVGGNILHLDTGSYGALSLQDIEASWGEYGLRGGAAWMDAKNDDRTHAKVCLEIHLLQVTDWRNVVRGSPVVTHMAQRPYDPFPRYQPAFTSELRVRAIAGVIPQTPSVPYNRPILCSIGSPRSRAMLSGRSP